MVLYDGKQLNNSIMNKSAYANLWSFFNEYLPGYYSRNDVLESDILFRFLDGDEISENDMDWIKEEYGGNVQRIRQECQRLDTLFFTESLQAFYDQLIRNRP